MSRVTKLIKLRRTSRAGWKRRAFLARAGDVRRAPPTYHFGYGTISLVAPDGTLTKIGVVQDISIDLMEDISLDIDGYTVPVGEPMIWGKPCGCIIPDEARRLLSGRETLTLSCTVNYKDEEAPAGMVPTEEGGSDAGREGR